MRIREMLGTTCGGFGGGGVKREKVTIVCGELFGDFRPSHAYRTSPEYVDLARYADQDALAEVLKLLPKLFPDIEVNYYTSKDLPSADRQNNLIVIGGPYFNRLTRDLLDHIRFPFVYRPCGSESCFKDISTKLRFEIQKRRNRIVKDYGLFAQFPNPLKPSNSVIMIGGLQTFGVLGTVKAFAMNAAGKKNTNMILKKNQKKTHFAVIIPIDVLNTQPIASTIDMKTFRELDF